MRHRWIAIVVTSMLASTPLLAQGPALLGTPVAAPAVAAPAVTPGPAPSATPAPSTAQAPADFAPPAPYVVPQPSPPPPPMVSGFSGPPILDRPLPAQLLPYRVWVRPEFLIWWVKGTPLPPIAAVTDNSGNSQTAIGDGTTNFGALSGFRIGFGAWFDDAAHIGFDSSFFGLERAVNHQAVISDDNGGPAIGLSFVNAAPGQSGEFLQMLSIPGAFAGDVFVRSTLEMSGAEINAAFCLVRTGCFELTGLVGFRYLEMNENLFIDADSTDVASGGFLSLSDHFATHNQFYGGQVGAKMSWQTGRFSVDGAAKLALGGTQNRVDITGFSFDSFGNSTVGGFFAQPSNIGRFTSSSFSVVPSVELKLNYQIGAFTRFFLGYDFLYWNQVVRPGDQVDRNLNLTQSALLTGGPFVGARSPTPLMSRSDFWAQGMTIGFEFRF
jgi:hypothetical protein